MTEIESLSIRVKEVLELAGFHAYFVEKFDNSDGVTLRFDVWEEE